jgi:signal peptidase I
MTPVALPVAGCIAAAGGALAWWVRRRFVVVTVHGSSMVPAYAAGDRVLIRRVALNRVRAGAVVVVAPGRPAPGGGRLPAVERAAPGRSMTRPPWVVKRAVAVPGDPVPPEVRALLGAAAGQPVPPGRFLAYGDNPGASTDSRQIGYFYAEYLLGVVVSRLGS